MSVPTKKIINVGDTINGKTILWMDNPSPLIPDMLVKVGVFDGIIEDKNKCTSCGTIYTTANKKYTNIKLIRISEI